MSVCLHSMRWQYVSCDVFLILFFFFASFNCHAFIVYMEFISSKNYQKVFKRQLYYYIFKRKYRHIIIIINRRNLMNSWQLIPTLSNRYVFVPKHCFSLSSFEVGKNYFILLPDSIIFYKLAFTFNQPKTVFFFF